MEPSFSDVTYIVKKFQVAKTVEEIDNVQTKQD